MEVEFGIEEYIGGKKEVIPCVLKQMYTDFIVEEILEDKRVLSVKVGKSEVPCLEIKEPDASIPVPEFISAETLVALDQIGKKGEDGKITVKAFSVPTKDLSKEQRTALHGFIRNRYHGQLNSETEGETVDVTLNQTCTGGRKRKRWCPTLGSYLHFTLAKENKDTSYALGIVAKFIGVKQDLFRTCGIKDRRAVTAQRVSCYRVEKERLMALNPRLREIHLSDFEYKEEGLKMGGHWGNRFHIVLRNMPEDCVDTIMERAKSLSDNGFINYFGTQRFGSCTSGTADTGKLIIQRKWEEAIKHILFSGTHHSKGTVPDAIACFKETGDAALAFKKLKGGQSFASIEGTILRCLSRNGTWQQCLCDALPVNMRSLYVHAYQSLLWNKIASRRMREFGMTVTEDDVDAEGKCLEGKGTIYDVYIPLPGTDINLFPKYAQPWVTELLEADGLTTQSIRGLKDRFALGDCSRPLMVLPTDVKADFIRYTDPRALLQNGLKEEELLVGDKEDKSLPLLALKIEFSLPQGTYATVALREVTGYDMGKKNMMNFGKAAGDAAEADNGIEEKAESDDEVDPA